MGRYDCSLPTGENRVTDGTPWLSLGAFDAVEQVAAIAKRQSSPVHRRGRTVTRGCSRETDRQRQTIRRREKKFRSGTAEEKGRGRRRETKRRRCGELEATLGFACIIESRAEHSGAVEGFASRERYRNNQTRVVPRGWSRSRDTVPATCKRPRFVVTALRRKRTNACTVSGAPRHVTDRRWTTTFFGQCVSNKIGRSREKLVRLFARRTSIDEGYGV